MKYFIVIKCEYPEGYLTSQGYSIHTADKYYYQPVIEYNPITEEYSYGEGGTELPLKIIDTPPVYFDSEKEAKEVAKLIDLYEKTEDVLDKTLKNKTPRKDNDMIGWEILVCSKK